MGPAQAMGAFLRTWRAEWAGLSRAQLALAVSRHCPKRRGITPAVIREWEAGQVPATTEELAALCTVMEQRGLSPWEVGKFRQAVFAACVGQHYPELSPDQGWARRADVDAAAAAAVEPLQHAAPGGWDIVGLVVAAQEVETALRAPEASGSRHRRRQLAAVAYLWDTIVSAHYFAGRHPLAARMGAQTADLLEEHFGPEGLGSRLRVSGARRTALLAGVASRAGVGGAENARELVRLCVHDWEVGAHLDGMRALGAALFLSSAVSEAERAGMVAMAEAAVPRLADLVGPFLAGELQLSIVGQYRNQGRWPAAERILAAVEPTRDAAPLRRWDWRYEAGLVALGLGHRGEAHTWLNKALQVAQEIGWQAAVQTTQRDLALLG